MKTIITSHLTRTALLCAALLFALPATTVEAGDDHGHHRGHQSGHRGGLRFGLSFGHGGLHGVNIGYGREHYRGQRRYYGGGLSYSSSRSNFGHVGGYNGYGGLHGRNFGGLNHSRYAYRNDDYCEYGGPGNYRVDDSNFYAPSTYPSRELPYREPTYTTPPPAPPQVDPYPDPARRVDDNRDNGRGWEFLASGFYDRALTAFAREASRNPKEGRPKVGYSLATAATGNLTRGASSMRRVFRIDPEAVHYIMIDKNLAPTIHQLIDRYEDRQARTTYSRDTSFMLAALHFLRRDLTTARADIRQALDYGDRTVSAVTLERMIADEMESMQNANAEYDEELPVDETTPSTQPVPPVPPTSDAEADY